MHHAQIAGTETKKLKGQIFDLERKAGLRPLIRPSSGVPHRMGDSLDVLGHIPWHPAGRGRSTTPLCKASPEMNTVSLKLLQYPNLHIHLPKLHVLLESKGHTVSSLPGTSSLPGCV